MLDAGLADRFGSLCERAQPMRAAPRADLVFFKGYAARLALVLHLARWVAAAGTGAGSQPGVIGPESIEAGIILSRWFGAEAERAYAILAETRGLVDLGDQPRPGG